MSNVLFIILFCLAFASTFAFTQFRSSSTRANGFSLKMALDENAISKLDEIRFKYDRLSNVVSSEADAERAKISDIAEKYATYREIKALMGNST